MDAVSFDLSLVIATVTHTMLVTSKAQGLKRIGANGEARKVPHRLNDPEQQDE